MYLIVCVSRDVPAPLRVWIRTTYLSLHTGAASLRCTCRTSEVRGPHYCAHVMTSPFYAMWRAPYCAASAYAASAVMLTSSYPTPSHAQSTLQAFVRAVDRTLHPPEVTSQFQRTPTLQGCTCHGTCAVKRPASLHVAQGVGGKGRQEHESHPVCSSAATFLIAAVEHSVPMSAANATACRKVKAREYPVT